MKTTLAPGQGGYPVPVVIRTTPANIHASLFRRIEVSPSILTGQNGPRILKFLPGR